MTTTVSTGPLTPTGEELPGTKPRASGTLRLPRSPKILVGLALLLAFVILAIVGPWLAPYDPGKIVITSDLTPNSQHWLGQTQLGQDIWSQLLVGARPTIVVSFLAGSIATLLSIVIGITAGYVGGLTDEILSMLANVFLVLPALPLLIVVGSFLPKGESANSLLIGAIIALTGWAWGARVLRAQTLSLRNRDFVEAARIGGERTWRIISFEIVPNLVAVLAASFLFTVLYATGTYVALGFLGVLNPAVNWSWGSILFDATQGQAVSSGQWWWYVPPGMCIALLGTSLALINFGIDEFINPRLRNAGVSRKAAKNAGISRRPQLGFTPVLRRRGAGSADPPARQLADAEPPEPATRRRRRPGQPWTTSASQALEIRGLGVDYGLGDHAVHAVSQVDLTIRRGEVMGLAGESGSGKSTLAYAVTRLLRDPGVVADGDVVFHSYDGLDSDDDTIIDLLTDDEKLIRTVRWSQIAIVFQSALQALNPVLTVGVLLDDVLAAHRPGLSKRARRERSAELLDMVGITADRLDSYPHELSGGMRQRAMIAISIALEPQLLIMDEPTTALDVVIQRQILDELMELRKRLGFSILFITHDLSLLIELADTIAVMYAGRLVEKAPAEDLFHSPRHPYTQGLLNSFPNLHGKRRAMSGIPGSPPDLQNVPAGCPFHPRCAYAMDECRTARPPTVESATGHQTREVTCWLHDGKHDVPVELDRRDGDQGARGPGALPVSDPGETETSESTQP